MDAVRLSVWVERIATVLVAGVLPLVGVLLLGWDWRPVLVLYWLENIVVGALTIIRLLRSRSAAPDSLPIDTGLPASVAAATRLPFTGVGPLVVRVLASGFFAVHYGIFTLVHGVFVFALIAGRFGPSTAPPSDAVPLPWPTLLLTTLIGAGVQVWMELRRPRSTDPVTTIMAAPYSRIVVLHLAILGGGFLISLLGWPPIAAVALIGIRMIQEVRTWRARPAGAGASQLGVGKHAGPAPAVADAGATAGPP